MTVNPGSLPGSTFNFSDMYRDTLNDGRRSGVGRGFDHLDRAPKQLGGGRRIAVGRGVDDGERRIRADLFTDAAHVGETDPSDQSGR